MRCSRFLSSAPYAVLSYDALDRLATIDSSTDSRFAYDGLDVIGEYDGLSALRNRYVFVPGIDEPLVSYNSAGTRTWLTADERGSIVAHSNDNGAVTLINRYDEYGVPASTNEGRFQYTGQMWLSEAGVYHYKFRAYDPKLGRFLQTDPIDYTGGMNLYAYVGDDPVSAADPMGLLVTYCTGSIIPSSSGLCEHVNFLSINGTDTQAAYIGISGAIADDLPGVSSAGVDQILACIHNPTATCLSAPLEGWIGLSRPGYGNDPLSFQPLTPHDQAIMDRIRSSPEYQGRSDEAWERTIATGLEHGFFIWLTQSGFVIGRIWQGTPTAMGRRWQLYAMYEAGNFWASFHTHPGWWRAVSGPSSNDLRWNERFQSIGIIRSRWSEVYGY